MEEIDQDKTDYFLSKNEDILMDTSVSVYIYSNTN